MEKKPTRFHEHLGLAVLAIVLASCQPTSGNAPSEARSPPPTTPTKTAAPSGVAQPYEIIETKGLDIAAIVGGIDDPQNEHAPRVRRRSLKVVVPVDISRADLDATLRKVVNNEAQKKPDVDEINVFAYGRREDAQDAYTYGMVEWAPGGKWGSTTPEIAASHDRSSYDYSIDIKSKVGNPGGRPSKEQYAIYDAVMAKMTGDYSKSDNPEQAAIWFVAADRKLSGQQVEESYTKVAFYNIK